MNANETFESGDVVKFIEIPGPTMLVVGASNGLISCQWFDQSNRFCEHDFLDWQLTSSQERHEQGQRET